MLHKEASECVFGNGADMREALNGVLGGWVFEERVTALV
jgi:hypothetical protein